MPPRPAKKPRKMCRATPYDDGTAEPRPGLHLFTSSRQERNAIIAYYEANREAARQQEIRNEIKRREAAERMGRVIRETDPVEWARGAVRLALAVPYLEIEYCDKWLDRPYPEFVFKKMAEWWGEGDGGVPARDAAWAKIRTAYRRRQFTEWETEVIKYWYDSGDTVIPENIADPEIADRVSVPRYLIDSALYMVTSALKKQPFTVDEQAAALAAMQTSDRPAQHRDRSKFDQTVSEARAAAVIRLGWKNVSP
jgi:hypothetical protein